MGICVYASISIVLQLYNDKKLDIHYIFRSTHDCLSIYWWFLSLMTLIEIIREIYGGGINE